MNCVQLTSALQQWLLVAALSWGGPATAPPPPVVQAASAPTVVATSPGLGTLMPGWLWSLFG